MHVFARTKIQFLSRKHAGPNEANVPIIVLRDLHLNSLTNFGVIE